MSDEVSDNLALPYLQPSQAQKHVIHNEALERLDILVQLTVEAFGATEPPSLPEPGAVYALGSGATGAWAGHDGELAAWVGEAWLFITPRTGWRAAASDGAQLRIWDGADWAAPLDGLDRLGINTSADSTNRLAVAAPATLLNHEDGDHRLVINKAGAADTATAVFQSGFSGRAEMGLAGEDDFSFKVSPDGASWIEALRIGTDGGVETEGHRVHHRGNVLGSVGLSGGTPTGAIIEEGSNANGTYVKFADGTMLVATVYGPQLDAAFKRGEVWASDPHQLAFPAVFSGIPAVWYEIVSPPQGYAFAARFNTDGTLTEETGNYRILGAREWDMSDGDDGPQLRALAWGRWN